MQAMTERIYQPTLASWGTAAARDHDPCTRPRDQTGRTVRILMAKFGESYEEATLRLAIAFREAGFEVIYTNAQKPEAVVQSAIQEDVDHIGITTLPGADLGNIRKTVDLLRSLGADDIRITAGGFLSYEDIPRVKEMGIAEFFPRGTTVEELIQWARDHIKPLGNP
jgi:methylmalonyl-CoA mutase C-terminal domain/subunit